MRLYLDVENENKCYSDEITIKDLFNFLIKVGFKVIDGNIEEISFSRLELLGHRIKSCLVRKDVDFSVYLEIEFDEN